MEKIKRKNGFRYREKIYIKGKEYKSSLFLRITDAKNWKATMLSKRSETRGQKKLFSDKITFFNYAQIWLEEKVKVRSSRGTYNNYLSNLKVHIYPLIGKILLENINRGHADRLVKKLKESGHNQKGINLIIGVFKRVLNEAVASEVLVKSPLASYKELKIPQREEVYLTKDEINLFLRVSRDHFLYPVYLTALNTGMRRGELAGLLWDKVDFERKQLIVSRTRNRYGLQNTTKTYLKRIIPMNDEVLNILYDLRKVSNQEQVFLKDDGTPIDIQHLYREFKKALSKAQITRRVRFHDPRHTFASHFMMNGGNIYDLQKILGHHSLEMTQRYAHLAPEHLARALRIISFSGETKKIGKKMNRPYIGHTHLRAVKF